MTYYHNKTKFIDPIGTKCISCGQKQQKDMYCWNCYNSIKNYNIKVNQTYTITEDNGVYYINKIYIYNNIERISLLSIKNNSNFGFVYKTIDFIKDIKSKKIIPTNKIYNEDTQENNNTINNNTNSFNNEDYRKNYQPEFRANDGHYVRSQGELLIDNWLYDNNILHEYEKRISVNNEEYYADFYIKNKNLYIEYFGITSNLNYTEKTNTKIKLYNNNNINCIYLFPKDLQHIQDILEDYIIKNKTQNISILDNNYDDDNDDGLPF